MGQNPERKIAIIDDDPAVLDSLKLLLEVAGYAVTAYSSASAFLEDTKTAPSCLIVDQYMPRMSGLDLVAQLRREGKILPALLITANPSSALLAHAKALGIEKLLAKPLNEGDLLGFIRAHC